MAKQELDTRFANFGTVSFAAVTQVNDFIGHLEQGRLMGTRCIDCGRRYFPPRAHCAESLSRNMEWFEVTGAGKLMGFSGLKYAPTGFKQDLPYTIALVEYGEYRVFGRIDPALPESELAVGMALKAVPAKTVNGRLTYLFQKA